MGPIGDQNDARELLLLFSMSGLCLLFSFLFFPICIPIQSTPPPLLPPGPTAAEELCIQCPFQGYGSQSSSYWYLFTRFQTISACLIATGTAQDPQFTTLFDGILDLPMALQSGIQDSSNTMPPPG